jgi:hypothetical protein
MTDELFGIIFFQDNKIANKRAASLETASFFKY